MGKQNIIAYSRNGKRILESAGKVTGRDFERGQWKRTKDGMVLPSDVARWLKNISNK